MWWRIWCWHIGKDVGGLRVAGMKLRCLEILANAVRCAMSVAESTRGIAYDVAIKRILGHIFVVYEGGRPSWP
jgi:hypothetical protein